MSQMDTDQELLRRYLDGSSQEAFTHLVNRHLSLVYHSALRQLGGDTESARDVSQMVFNTLARKASRLVAHPSLSGWLFTATRLAAQEELRRINQRRRREGAAYRMSTSAIEQPSDQDSAELIPRVDQWLSELNSSDRVAILLRYFDGLPYARIGQLLELTEDAARMRVDRALRKLRLISERKGVRSTSAAIAALLAQQGGLAAPIGWTTALVATAVGSATATAGSGALLISAAPAKIAGVLAAAAALAAVSAIAISEIAASHRSPPVQRKIGAFAIHPPAIFATTTTSSELDDLPDSSAHVEIRHLDKGSISTSGNVYACEIATTMTWSGEKLGLTALQREKVQWAYKRMGEAKAAIEHSLIKITRRQEHEVTLTIPPYPGDDLLLRFAADLDRLLGRGMGDKIFSTYQVAILRDNQGFGEYAQTYILHRNGNMVEYKHSWKMPLRAPTRFTWVAECSEEPPTHLPGDVFR